VGILYDVAYLHPRCQRDALLLMSLRSRGLGTSERIVQHAYPAMNSKLQDLIAQAILEATEPLYQEIAYDRQRIARLEQKEPQPLQRDRGEILRALIATNGGKMLAKEARLKMHLSEPVFSLLLSAMKDSIEKRPYHLNRSAKVLILR
jgi:hypothetical protein